jgi:hypothetical protein
VFTRTWPLPPPGATAGAAVVLLGAIVALVGAVVVFEEVVAAASFLLRRCLVGLDGSEEVIFKGCKGGQGKSSRKSSSLK